MPDHYAAAVAQPLIASFVAELAQRVELPEPIVEFGSLQVEPGQPNDLRQTFAGRDFTGTDMRPGPGVDRIEDLRGLSYADGTVGTALCLDTLEHCADPLAACRELHRVLAADGVCVLSSVMFFPVHGYPQDFWRFTPEGMKLLLEPFAHRWATGVGHPELPMQVVAVGTKRRALELDGLRSLGDAQRAWDRAEGTIRFGVLHIGLRELGRAVAGQLPRAVGQRLGSRLRGRG